MSSDVVIMYCMRSIRTFFLLRLVPTQNTDSNSGPVYDRSSVLICADCSHPKYPKQKMH